ARADIQFEHFSTDTHGQGRANQPRRHRIGIVQHPNGAEATDDHLHFAAGMQWRFWEWPKGWQFVVPARSPGSVAPAYQLLEPGRVCGSVGKVAASAHAQSLVDQLLDAEMGLLNIAILVCF